MHVDVFIRVLDRKCIHADVLVGVYGRRRYTLHVVVIKSGYDRKHTYDMRSCVYTCV